MNTSKNAINLLIERYSRVAIPFLFFLSVFVYFYHPIKGGDFWWHLNTGRWIWQNGELPSEDPFSYTTTPKNADRTALVLKGYWLSDAAYYVVYKYSGARGLIALNSAVFTLVAFILWRILRLHGMNSAFGLVMTAPFVFFAGHYDEIRPQNFTFLFIPALISIIENGIRQLRNGLRPSALYLLPLIVIPWANMYRGFIIVYPIFGAYLAGELLAGALGKGIPRLKLFAFWIVLGSLLTLLNPNFLNPLTFGVKEATGWADFGNFAELRRPWEYTKISGSRAYIRILLLVAVFSTSAVVLAWRRLKFSHILLYAGFAAAGATTYKLTILFVIVAIAVSGRYVSPECGGRIGARLNSAKWMLPAAGLAILLSYASWKDLPAGGKFFYDEALPVRAAGFMAENRPPQPMFNTFEWGAYLSWRLFPEYKVFIDSRFLDPRMFGTYETARQQSYTLETLDAFGINTVIFPPTKGGFIEGVVICLLKDNERWRLVYFDDVAAIFVRNGSAALPASGRDRLIAYLLSFASAETKMGQPIKSKGYFDLALIYNAIGNEHKSREAYNIGLITGPGGRAHGHGRHNSL